MLGHRGFRREILGELLEDVRFDCIRGKKSEIAALIGIPFRSKGVETVSLELADEAVHGLDRKNRLSNSHDRRKRFSL